MDRIILNRMNDFFGTINYSWSGIRIFPAPATGRFPDLRRLRQYRIIAQERFASKFSRTDEAWFCGNIWCITVKSQQSQDTKFPQSAAAFIMLCCLRTAAFPILQYQWRKWQSIPRLQWRDRAGFTPASLLPAVLFENIQRHRLFAYLLIAREIPALHEYYTIFNRQLQPFSGEKRALMSPAAGKPFSARSGSTQSAPG